jgi:2-polyprenyl-3-methyl-5-hydroxy-6-metoxy-1,4-benzoquinol methylase
LTGFPPPAIMALVGNGCWLAGAQDEATEIAMLAGIYDAIRRRTSPQMRQRIKQQSWIMPIVAKAVGSDIYSASYYEEVEKDEAASVRAISDWIVREINPRGVVDIGCGPGHLMEALDKKGVSVLGLDYSAAARDFLSRKGLPFEIFDLTDPDGIVPGAPWDLAVCCEVAEHLDPRHADVFVSKLASASDIVFLTAAIVGQGGLNHLNEQPNSYWIAKFAAEGFDFDDALTAHAREIFTEKGVVHYLARPMIFRKAMQT